MNGGIVIDTDMTPRVSTELTQETVTDPNLRTNKNDAIDFAIEVAPQSGGSKTKRMQ